MDYLRNLYLTGTSFSPQGSGRHWLANSAPNINFRQRSHPQTDGQTERMNQTLEQYLCCYINDQQDNWVELLPLAQFAYNSAKNETIQESPFYANYGFEPTAYQEPIPSQVLAQKGILRAYQLKELHQQLSLNIQFIAYRTAKYHNQHHRKGPELKKGDKVYLLRKNVRTKRPNNKLNFKKIGPFEIAEKKGEVNFRLKLPDTMRIHPVFHISLLEPAPTNARPVTETEEILPENPDDDKDYEVEKVLDSGIIDGRFMYLLKWMGSDDAENSWQPIENCDGCKELLREFHLRNPDRPKPEDLRPPKKTRRPRKNARTARENSPQEIQPQQEGQDHLNPHQRRRRGLRSDPLDISA
ncbi:hypothetical protein VTN00DRAFT_3477 [Thermoascus crustaceus]|uniref:uncharacterized protein n=1 Tax=Thermoascus crustaceus TaxID=5088 RepID=UPI0037422530